MSKVSFILAGVGGLAWTVCQASALAQCAEDQYWWVTEAGNWSSPDNWRHEETNPDPPPDCMLASDVPGCDDWAWINNGGKASISDSACAHWVEVDDSTGLWLLSGSLTTREELVGNQGPGATLTHSGGRNTIRDLLSLGVQNGSDGTYVLEDGELIASAISIGTAGSGAFIQHGGRNGVEDWLTTGDAEGGVGEYMLTGGDLSAYFETVGFQGTGTFNHTGGTNTIIHVISIGTESGSTGDYSLGGSGELYARFETVGIKGTGAFTQSGGTNTIMQHLMVGGAPGGRGTYSLSGDGVLSARFQSIGAGGTGTFTHSGGVNTVVQQLNIGGGPESSGVYDLSGEGELFAAFATVGGQGTGTFYHQAGTHTVVRDLVLGEAPESNGVYYLDAQAVLSAHTLIVGGGGTGRFTQAGGSNPIISRLALGEIETGAGTYELDDNGWLFAWTGEIGVEGTGTFHQFSGMTTLVILALGDEPGSEGTYELRDGQLAAGFEAIGDEGIGVFRQTGGMHSVSFLEVGSELDSHGTYELGEGAELAVGELAVGDGGDGEFKQTGGASFVASEFFYLGVEPGASGSYVLTGGELTHRGPFSQTLVGAGGAGVLSIGVAEQTPSARLDATWVSVGTGLGAGTLEIFDPEAEIVVGWLTFGPNATFKATRGTSIRITDNNIPTDQGGRGFVDNQSIDEGALSGLENLNLICDGPAVVLEVAGYDGGHDPDFCTNNFVVDTLTVNGVAVLKDDFDNGNRGGNAGWNEALYLNDLVCGPDGILYTYGLHVYDCVDPPLDACVCTGSEKGDKDRDCDVDLKDYSWWPSCMTGPDRVPVGPFPPHCAVFDADFDWDSDLSDFAGFQLVFTDARKNAPASLVD